MNKAVEKKETKKNDVTNLRKEKTKKRESYRFLFDMIGRLFERG